MHRLTRRANITVLVVIAGSLAAVPLLLPSDAELGSHLLSDSAHDDAQRYLEAALRRQATARDVVMPLAKVYSEQGHHDEALDLLERLEGERPIVSAMRRRLLRRSGRLLTYAEGLEQQDSTLPSPQELRELARVYAAQGLRSLQLSVLRRLRQTAPYDIALARQVAYLCSQTGRSREALEIMRDLWRWRPTRLSRDDFLFFARLAVRLDRGDDAYDAIAPHIGRVGRRGDRVDIARAMISAGHFRQAAQLVEPLVAAPNAADEVVEVWALAQIARGHADATYARLRRRVSSASTRTIELVCRLALRQGDDLGALRMAGQIGFVGLEDNLLVSLAGAAMRRHSKARLSRILKQISPKSLMRDPVTTAHMYWSVGDHRAALRWARRALAAPQLSRAQKLWLADLYLRAHKPRQVARLMRAAGTPDGRGASPLGIALMWWRVKRPREGLRGWPARSRDRRSRAGRALLLAATGEVEAAYGLLRGERGLARALRAAERRSGAPGSGDTVAAWLQALSAEAQRVQGSLGRARTSKRPRARASRQLLRWAYRARLQLDPKDRALRLALAQLQLADRRHAAAWATVRQLRPPLTKAEAATRRQVLLAAYDAKLPVKDALIREAQGFIAELPLRGAEAQSWLHLLLKLGALQQARPYVERLAATGDSAWQSRRVQLLTDLGEHAAVRSWWRSRGADARLPAAARLHAAAQLLAGKDRAGALAICRAVAERQGPDGAAVHQLLQLWGPHPGPEAVAWLSKRAEGARGARRAAWLRHLVAIKAMKAVRTLLAGAPRTGPLFDVAVDTLVAEARYDELGKLTLARVPTLRRSQTVRRLAQLCSAHGQRAAAVAAYQRLASLNPQDGVALRFLAQSAQGAKAIEWWQRFFALPRSRRPPPIWQDRATLGALLTRAGRRNEGLQQLRVALRLADREPPATRAAVRGRLLARLGRHVEASAALMKAVRAKPCDDALRGDLVGALMAVERREEARKWIDPPSSCSAGGSR